MGRSRTAGERRVWRWDPADGADPQIEDPPGARQPGLALLDPAGSPRVALGRHPVRHSRDTRHPAWHHQHVLEPPAGPGASWSAVAVFEDRFDGGALLDPDGTVLACVERPGRVRRVVQVGDTVEVDGIRYGLEPVHLSLPAGRRRRFWTPEHLVGIRLTGPSAGEVRADLVADRDRGFDGDVTSPVRADWSAVPGRWEAAVALACLACAIDGDLNVSND
jgi:hypothetical protein